jgi:hypothetical protein
VSLRVPDPRILPSFAPLRMPVLKIHPDAFCLLVEFTIALFLRLLLAPPLRLLLMLPALLLLALLAFENEMPSTARFQRLLATTEAGLKPATKRL